jgi:chromosome segregation ATPase
MSAKDDLESQLQEARHQIELVENQKEALQASLPEIAGGGDELIELKEAVEKLDRANTDLRNEKAMLENDREDLQLKLSTMETQLAEAQTNLENGKERHENLKCEIYDLNSKNHDLSSLLDETRATLEAAKGSKGHGEDTNFEHLVAKVNNLTEALRAKEEELKSLNDVMTEGEEVVQKWEGK